MEVEKKVTISFTKEEQSFLKELYDTLDTTVCYQYNNCGDCPFRLYIKATNSIVCTSQKFFSGLEAISNY